MASAPRRVCPAARYPARQPRCRGRRATGGV